MYTNNTLLFFSPNAYAMSIDALHIYDACSLLDTCVKHLLDVLASVPRYTMCPCHNDIYMFVTDAGYCFVFMLKFLCSH